MNQAKMIEVELVLDRDVKEDCRAGTGTVWHGKGDVQPFPEHLWPKLAAHPDVWRRVDGKADDAAPPTYATGDGNPPAAEKALANGVIEPGPVEVQHSASGKDGGPENDLVYVLNGGDVIQILPVTSEQLNQVDDAAVRQEAKVRGYNLNARLSPINLRGKFMEAQAIQLETREAAEAKIREAAKSDPAAGGDGTDTDPDAGGEGKQEGDGSSAPD